MIDVCVVNHNTAKLLKRFVDVLHTDDRQPKPFRLFMVDNGSTDDSQAVFDAMCVDHPTWNGVKYEDVVAWKFPNVGFATACNYMAAQGTGDIIGLLNADVWLTRQDLINIQQVFDSESTISIVGPKQRNEQNRIVHAGIIGTNEKPKHQGWQAHDPLDKHFRQMQDCVTVSGSAYFIRRSVWNELTDCPIYKGYVRNTMGNDDTLGAFLPTRHYYEETACSYHARAHGYRVVYAGHISIGHTWHASMAPNDPLDGQMMSESREIFRGFCDAHEIAHD